MAVTINADTTNGLVITPDTSGDLSFQSSGNNIFTIDSSGNTVFSGALSWSGDLAVDTNTLYVDSANNNVGIGTSSPSQELEVVGEVLANNFRLPDSGGTISGSRTVTGAAFQLFDTAQIIRAYTAGTQRMVITSTGNVGIGTSSPSAKLHIATSASAGTTQEMIELQSLSGVDNVNLRIGGTAYTGGHRAHIDFNLNAGTNFQSYMAFGTSAGAGTVERMRITSAGNVGIGTSSPVTKLDISAASNPRIRFEDTGDFEWRIGIVDNNSFGFFSAGTVTERMRIDSSGNVGIGKTNPVTKLEVNGAVAIQGGAGFPSTGKGWELLVQSATACSIQSYNRDTSVWMSSKWYALEHIWLTNSTEHMRLDSSGNLKFNSGYGSAATAYGCRAWVNFNGSGTVAIRASGNVSSITDNGTGRFRPNFATAMPDSNYCVIAADSATATYGSDSTSGAVTICGVINATQAFITVQATSGGEYDAQGIFMAAFR